MTQRIIPLSECPQFADVCAAWAFGQWGSQRGGSLARTQLRFAQCSRPSDDRQRQDLTPWLAGVFVHPDHRRKGIAHRLEMAIVEAARQRHHSVLHLITDKSEALYAGWGWHPVERRRQHDEEVVVMAKTL
ncbi:GNAT family N-acetyltransferase [Serratia nematodiphila]